MSLSSETDQHEGNNKLREKIIYFMSPLCPLRLILKNYNYIKTT